MDNKEGQARSRARFERERDARRTTTKNPKDRAQVFNNMDAARRNGVNRRVPILETAFHREMADPAYLDSLLDYVDEHLFI